MRIVFLTDYLPPEHNGGAEKVVWKLAVALRNVGHDIHIITTTVGKPSEQQQEGIATYRLHSRYPVRFRLWFGLFNPQTADPLKTLIQRIKPDVVNAHNVHNQLSFYSLHIVHQMGIPVVFSAHDVMSISATKLTHFVRPGICKIESMQEYRLPAFHNLRMMRLRYNPVFYPAVRHLINNDAQIGTAVSSALKSALEVNGLPNFRVFYGAVNPAEFDVSRQVVDQLRRKLGLEHRKVILFGGRTTREKGSLELLKALAHVIGRVPDASLLMLTSAKIDLYSLGIQSLARLIEPHILQGGWLTGSELAAAYHLADVVTVPSICLDSFPVMNLEAMAAGKPLVSTCFGGSSEAVIDGETGFIVNPLDNDLYAERMIQLLLDPDLSNRMGQGGRQRLQENFTVQIQSSKLLDLFHDARAR